MGVASEKLVNLALMLVDRYRATSRADKGTIMGSRDLKIIGVHGVRFKLGAADLVDSRKL